MLVSFYDQAGVVGNVIAYVLRRLAGDQGKLGVVLVTAYFGVCYVSTVARSVKYPGAAGVIIGLALMLTI